MCISLDNRSGNFTAKQIQNVELRKYANELAKDAMNIRANLLHMSAVMAAIASRSNDGILAEFDNSLVKFAEERLGIKKSQAYSMVQVGATFLDSKGNVLISANVGSKWSNTQLMALLPMAGTGKNKRGSNDTRVAVEKLIEDGLISSDMTVAEIKSVVAEQRPDAKAKAKQKASRKAKANSKAKIQNEKANNAVVIEDEQPAFDGTCIATLQFMQAEDGSITVLFNGEDQKFDDSNIKQIITMMQGANNYNSK